MQKQSMPANGQCSKLEETHICELGTWVRAISVLLGALLAPDHWAAQTDLGVAAKVDGIRNNELCHKEWPDRWPRLCRNAPRQTEPSMMHTSRKLKASSFRLRHGAMRPK